MSLTKAKPGEAYNICSGRGYKIGTILDMLLDFSKVAIEIKVDKKKLRPTEVMVRIGDNRKFVAETHWKPEIPIRKTLKGILDYWRNKT
jgi:GDP-4-dehydro-6-deoxy-D-mannose reductase